jgi:hypothetical protein
VTKDTHHLRKPGGLFAHNCILAGKVGREVPAIRARKLSWERGPPTSPRRHRSNWTGAIINLDLKLSYTVRVGLLAVSILSSSFFCAGQSAAQAPTPDPASSAPPSAATPPNQDKPGDQPSAQNSPAQNSSVQEGPKKDEAKKDEPAKKKDDRMFYVMPNYLTVDSEAEAKPVSWKEKFSMAAKGSFDPYEFTLVGVVAGIHQAADNDPGFGQGFKGYAKRYGAAFADQVDGNIMVGGVFPTILKVDPRYFRLGKGSFGHRLGYALDRILIARKDSGGHVFNISEFAGNAVAIGISNAYYPAADRNFSGNFSDWTTQMGLDAFGNTLKEFWPDIHQYLQQSHDRKVQKQQQKLLQKQQQKAPN